MSRIRKATEDESGALVSPSRPHAHAHIHTHGDEHIAIMSGGEQKQRRKAKAVGRRSLIFIRQRTCTATRLSQARSPTLTAIWAPQMPLSIGGATEQRKQAKGASAGGPKPGDAEARGQIGRVQPALGFISQQLERHCINPVGKHHSQQACLLRTGFLAQSSLEIFAVRRHTRHTPGYGMRTGPS